jgi:hypothetical protein
VAGEVGRQIEGRKEWGDRHLVEERCLMKWGAFLLKLFLGRKECSWEVAGCTFKKALRRSHKSGVDTHAMDNLVSLLPSSPLQKRSIGTLALLALYFRKHNFRTADFLNALVVAATAGSAVAATRLWKIYGKFVSEVVLRNDYLVLILSGSFMGGLTWIASLARQKIKESLWTTLTIKSSETAVWEALIKHLTANDTLASKVLTAKKKKGKNKSWRQRNLDWSLGKNAIDVEYTPGDHCNGLIQFEGEKIFLQRYPDGKKETVGWSRQLVQPEVITLQMWGQDSSVLKRFLQMAVSSLGEETDDEINIMCISNGWPGGWQKAVTKKVRSLESVVLDGSLQQDLLADAKKFLAASSRYEEAGIPFRRGYLLYGPPGCGKTSFCQALAGALKLDVCMLSLSNKDMNDNDLAENLRDAPPNAIVLLEDVDAVSVSSVSSASTARCKHCTV